MCFSGWCGEFKECNPLTPPNLSHHTHLISTHPSPPTHSSAQGHNLWMSGADRFNWFGWTLDPCSSIPLGARNLNPQKQNPGSAPGSTPSSKIPHLKFQFRCQLWSNLCICSLASDKFPGVSTDVWMTKALTCSLVGPSCEKNPRENTLGCWRK